jgi:hypothetical protein
MQALMHSPNIFSPQLLESKGMFTNHASDEVLVSPDSVGNIDPLHHDLGWSFSDSACSLFSSLAADRTFYHHFHSCRTQHPMAFATLNGLADADFSSSHTATYVHSKILPNACGSIEHMNIMYWTVIAVFFDKPFLFCLTQHRTGFTCASPSRMRLPMTKRRKANIER